MIDHGSPQLTTAGQHSQPVKIESFDFDTELELDDSVFQQLDLEVTQYLQTTSEEPLIKEEQVKDESKEEVTHQITMHSDVPEIF